MNREALRPPQMIIWLPVQTAEWSVRALGAPVWLIEVQVLDAGSYRLPSPFTPLSLPPQTIKRDPSQMEVSPCRGLGTGPDMLMGVHVEVNGLYLLPPFAGPYSLSPPQA